jgi:hypothetical protein
MGTRSLASAILARKPALVRCCPARPGAGARRLRVVGRAAATACTRRERLGDWALGIGRLGDWVIGAPAIRCIESEENFLLAKRRASPRALRPPPHCAPQRCSRTKRKYPPRSPRLRARRGRVAHARNRQLSTNRTLELRGLISAPPPTMTRARSAFARERSRRKNPPASNTGARSTNASRARPAPLSARGKPAEWQFVTDKPPICAEKSQRFGALRPYL